MEEKGSSVKEYKETFTLFVRTQDVIFIPLVFLGYGSKVRWEGSLPGKRKIPCTLNFLLWYRKKSSPSPKSVGRSRERSKMSTPLCPGLVALPDGFYRTSQVGSLPVEDIAVPEGTTGPDGSIPVVYGNVHIEESRIVEVDGSGKRKFPDIWVPRRGSEPWPGKMEILFIRWRGLPYVIGPQVRTCRLVVPELSHYVKHGRSVFRLTRRWCY